MGNHSKTECHLTWWRKPRYELLLSARSWYQVSSSEIESLVHHWVLTTPFVPFNIQNFIQRCDKSWTLRDTNTLLILKTMWHTYISGHTKIPMSAGSWVHCNWHYVIIRFEEVEILALKQQRLLARTSVNIRLLHWWRGLWWPTIQ